MVLSPGGALWRPRVLPEFLCGASDRMLPVPDLLSLTFCALQGIKAPYTEALSNNKGAVVGLKLNKLVSDDTTEMAKKRQNFIKHPRPSVLVQYETQKTGPTKHSSETPST